MLRARQVDLGLIPVAELLKHNDYMVLPDLCISSNGKVDSVVLVTKKEIEQTKLIAVDNRSQSSTALLGIIMELFVGVKPQYVPKTPSSGFLDDVDGGMIIGNTGLEYCLNPPNGYNVYDLGELWTEYTCTPFVYAVFAAHQDTELSGVLDALKQSFDLGMQDVEKIASKESKVIDIPEDACLRYLTERIFYNLGPNERKGILKYNEYLNKMGEVELITELNFCS